MILNARASNRIYHGTLETRPGEAFAYTYNKRNRLTSVTRNSVAYASYTYNALEQLTSRTTSGAGQSHMEFLVESKREQIRILRRTSGRLFPFLFPYAIALTSGVGAPAGQVAYLYDLDGHLIAEANASTGATTRDYIWAASNDNNPVDLPLAIAESATLTMVHADHLGRPTRMTSAAKATVWQAIWKPWGEVHALSGTLTQNLRFPGQYVQIETGLHHNHHRTYDPITGRYTQADPLRFVDGPSVYAYAGSSPYMNVDRSGLANQSVPPGPFTGGYSLGLPGWLFKPKSSQVCLPNGDVSFPPVFESAPGNQRDSGLQGVSDADISAGARDKSKSSEERRRYQKEEKARGLRNRTKRNEQQRK